MTELTYDSRFYDITRQNAVNCLIDLFIEQITNAIDAYKSSGTSRNSLIEIYVNNDLNNLYVIVKDHAKGLTSQEMRDKLLTIGSYTAEETSRGMIGRGAKDCSALGDIEFTAIKDNKLSKCIITHDAKAQLLIEDIPVTEEDRKKIGILNNGMLVKSIIKSSINVGTNEQIYRSLCKNIQLRDIVTDPNTTIIFEAKDGENNIFKNTLKYTYPEGKKILTIKYEVPDYPGVDATLTLFKAKQEIPNPANLSELDYGILIKSNTTIYECGALYYGEKGTIDHLWDPNIKYIYGSLTCNAIDTLAREAASGIRTPQNPYLLIDANRRHGLKKEHPFTQALFKLGYQWLEIFLNRIQDTKDENVLTASDVSSVFEQLSNFIAEKIPLEKTLYTWRSKEDHASIINMANKIKNIEYDEELLSLSKEELNSLLSAKKEKIKINSENVQKLPVSIEFTDAVGLKDPYQIMYFPGKTILKVNANFPSIAPYLTKNEENQITFLNIGKGMVGIGSILGVAFSKMIVRQKILTGEIESEYGTDGFNQLDYHEKQVLNSISTSLYSSVVNTIDNMKSDKNENS